MHIRLLVMLHKVRSKNKGCWARNLGVHSVKAMVFPVVMYEFESWTIKKAEHRRIDAFNCGVGEDS